MVTGKKEQALRAARAKALEESLLQAVAGLTGNAGEGEAVEQSTAPPEKQERTVKTRKKTAARHNARTPIHDANGHGKSKREQIIDLARREHGCTLAEVLAKTGWPSVSMPQVAASQGAKLRRVKRKGEATRYFAA